jgi:hypothetical protein
MSAPRSIRAAIATLAVFAAAAALGTPVALAAPPETPETLSPPTAITATGATLHGVLNPGGPSEGGSYRFSYKQSATECEPGGTFFPVSPALALGKAKEAVSVTVTGLEPNKEYTFCVIAYSLGGGVSEPAAGAAVPFKTLPLPPTLGVEKALVTSTAATLEAELNPNNEPTNYTFEYSTTESGGVLTGTIVKLKGASALEGATVQTAGVSTGALLAPGTTYFYRVVAENAQSVIEVKPVEGAVQSFTTVPTPHTDPVTGVTATTAVLHGHLTLDSIETKYSFDYNTNGECANGSSTTPMEASAGTVSTEATNLQPSATYTVCLVTSNAFGSEVDPHVPLVQFPTLPAPPKVDGESVSSLTPISATLEAQINANNETTTYTLEYADKEAKLGTAAATVFKGEISGYGDQGVSAATENVLTPNTTYFYRVTAENAQSKTEGKPAQGTIQSFKTPPAVAPKIEPGSEHAVVGVGGHNVTFEVKVDPENLEATIVFEYATNESVLLEGNGSKVSGGSIPPVGFYWEGISGFAVGLQPGTSYYFRVAATNIGGTADGPVATFSTPPAPLVEETLPEATEITAHTAVITNITINPQIEAPAEEATYYVLYGTTEAYDHATPAPVHPGAGYGLTGKPVPAITLTGLTPGTTYHYAIVAHNLNGTTTSADHQFTTPGTPPLTNPPAIGNATASFVNETSAVINGEINPEGQPGTYQIQYGTSTSYGSSTPPAQIAPFTSAQGTITALTGLSPGTTYHYRLAASNAAGTSYGPDQTFTSSGAARSGAFTSFPVPATPLLAATPGTFPAERPATPPKHTLTKKQKLAAALKVCAKKRSKAKRAACNRQAHRKYGQSKSARK